MASAGRGVTARGNGSRDGPAAARTGGAMNGVEAPQIDRFGFIVEGSDGSTGALAMPVDVLRQREQKWLEMLRYWDKWITKGYKKVKLRCRKGIPPSLRARAWEHLSGSKYIMEQMPGKFEELDKLPGDPKWLEVIQKDLHRQFPFHELFRAKGGQGQQDLFRVLKAYTVYRPEEGYCQGQAPVAAVLLMHMPAEEAFWCFVQICEKYLPGYYSAGLESLQLDGEILFALLRKVSLIGYRHLKWHSVDPVLYMTEWFMCVFSRTLPWDSVLRVWDMFFCEGVKTMFRVGLVLLRHALGNSERVRMCPGLYETMEQLKNIPHEQLHEEYLVRAILELDISEMDIEKEHAVQLQRWIESRGEPSHSSTHRLHGARAIRQELEFQREALRLARRAHHKETTGYSPPPSPTPSITSTLSTLSTLSTMSQRRGKISMFREKELQRILRHRDKENEKERKRMEKEEEKERARWREQERQRAKELEKQTARQKELDRQRAKELEQEQVREKEMAKKTPKGKEVEGTKQKGKEKEEKSKDKPSADHIDIPKIKVTVPETSSPSNVQQEQQQRSSSPVVQDKIPGTPEPRVASPSTSKDKVKLHSGGIRIPQITLSPIKDDKKPPLSPASAKFRAAAAAAMPTSPGARPGSSRDISLATSLKPVHPDPNIPEPDPTSVVQSTGRISCAMEETYL
ncbi:TBC1 domain family member 10A-like [Petromyzon marinus]|uniref:TBC1 domain family member 10A-like isoform X2 n=1 Tax=Petromyzon marinus TaxID=7757 RepID=A0AAJ7TUR9_PETMA|nr:TBC1 domain family member 10A-like isoform X2 [Petromyzon marinus]